ncbi:formyltransferase [Actinidia rufa]|uniref:Formyltransferase n=1 Tax=Actinidia rufa TaxID=165716 RepID=A0A7J0EEH5_9ERIC|nr:formyltransferase [Actinidia rufa]
MIVVIDKVAIAGERRKHKEGNVAASVLDALFDASSAPDSLFDVAAIVTQPPSGRDRGRKVMPSPVAQHALDRGFPFGFDFHT